MLRNLAIGGICGFVACGAFADDASKEAKLRKLFELQQLSSRFDAQMAGIRTQATSTADQMMFQVRAQFDFPPEHKNRADEAYRKFIDTAVQPPATGEVVEMLVKSAAPKMTEHDVDAALAYFGSEAGQRGLAATRLADGEVAAIISQRLSVQRQQATETFLGELKAVVRDCNCARPPAAPK